MANDRPVSPRSGAPLPIGKPFTAGNEARKNGEKGGRRSAQVRAERKTLREELLLLLDEKLEDKKTGKKVGTRTAMSAAMIKQALNGNTKAYELIRDTIGEKPVENVTIHAGRFEALEAAFEGLDEE